MAKLQKSATLYDRDEKGELIPQEVFLAIDEDEPEQLAYKNTTVLIVPMMRGETKKILNEIIKNKDDISADFDGELIMKYCVDPKYDESDISKLKPLETTIIVNTIFRESGLEFGKKSRKKAIEDKEDEFAKNFEELSEIEKNRT